MNIVALASKNLYIYSTERVSVTEMFTWGQKKDIINCTYVAPAKVLH
jgi:hypothetical protein